MRHSSRVETPRLVQMPFLGSCEVVAIFDEMSNNVISKRPSESHVISQDPFQCISSLVLTAHYFLGQSQVVLQRKVLHV